MIIASDNNWWLFMIPQNLKTIMKNENMLEQQHLVKFMHRKSAMVGNSIEVLKHL